MVDILVFAAHPDDAELAVSGTLLKHKKLGFKIGIIDLTRGELGSRGTAETRAIEAKKASELLELDFRENLEFKDGFIRNDQTSLQKVIEVLRRLKPKIVLANAMEDRHPDHGNAGKLLEEAVFLSGLVKYKTEYGGSPQDAFRPELVLHYVQDYYIKPDLVIDITEEIELKNKVIDCFSTQFFTGDSEENSDVQTPISGKDFRNFLNARATEFGRMIGAEYGEGFTKVQAVKCDKLSDLI